MFRSLLRKCLNTSKILKQMPKNTQLIMRTKNTQYQGIKGIRNRKAMYEARARAENENEENMDTELDSSTFTVENMEYDEVANTAMHVTRDFESSQNVLILQPYVKWGTKRNFQVAPDDQLREAEALIRSLPNWQIAMSLKVPLQSLDRKTLLGSGKTTELKDLISELRQRNIGEQKPLTCLFVSKSSLTFAQKRILEQEFNLPVMDRYSVVIQILRLHATSAEARLQVAMAEIPYIWSQVKDANLSISRRLGYSLTDTQREILKTRERMLRQELDKIRNHRKLLRNKRQQKNYPIVAVVGYTNAGKTSLIKALTQETSIQPRNQLFATLDVTAHAGVLPCKLEVIYMDTVGFMSDLPTGLIECFIATLEDAMLADIILHVQDLSHACCVAQRKHVENTLSTLAQNIVVEDKNSTTVLPPIINVGNKIDLISKDAAYNDDKNIHLVSSTQNTGLTDLLQDLEEKILQHTNRRKMKIRVPNGGNEMAWLYKNATVVDTFSDVNSDEHLIMHIVISDVILKKFKLLFCS